MRKTRGSLLEAVVSKRSLECSTLGREPPEPLVPEIPFVCQDVEAPPVL